MTIFSWHHHAFKLEFSVYQKIVKVIQMQDTQWEEIFVAHLTGKGHIQNI